MTPEIKNALQEGVDSEGGYLVPDEFERTLVQGLNAASLTMTLRSLLFAIREGGLR